MEKVDPPDVVTAKFSGKSPVPPAAYIHPLPLTMYDSPVAPVGPVAPVPPDRSVFRPMKDPALEEIFI